MIRALVFAAAAALSALTPATGAEAAGDSFELNVEAIPTSALLVVGGRAEFLGGQVLSAPSVDAFGGLSGLLLDGSTALAVTDRGAFVELSLERDSDGRILGVAEARIGRQAGLDGRPLRSWSADAEALARDAVSGVIWVAYERRHRILGRRSIDAEPLAEIDQLPTDMLSLNGGVEALAVAPDRAVLAIVEDPDGELGDILGYRLALGDAQPFRIARSGGYAPTGLDFAPDGSLYLLERRASFWTGMAMRIRRFPAADVRALQEGGDLGRGEPVLTVLGAVVVDNMEGLAVEAGPNGAHLLTAVSDDNFSGLQRTVLLQFRHRPLTE